jgi:hypothetical protein
MADVGLVAHYFAGFVLKMSFLGYIPTDTDIEKNKPKITDKLRLG